MSEKIIKITCPVCKSILWIDRDTEQVVKVEKHKAKKKSSLDELLGKELRKKELVDETLKAAFDISQKKKEEAKSKFEELISKDPEEIDD